MDTASEADVAAASAAASASGLAVFAAGGAPTAGQVGPCLMVGMGEAATVASLNSWGAARDSELVQLRLIVAAHAGELGQLRGDLGTTQTVVASAFEQAKAALQAIVDNFRVEAAKLRYDGEVAAVQSLSRLEVVVGEARARFDAQDTLVAQGLGELTQRLQRVDAWAQAEPARVAALVEAAPLQAQRWRRSPGGTTLAPGPLPPVPSTPPPRAQTGAWDAWAAGRGAAPGAPDAWAAAADAADASQTQPGGTRHFEMNTPGYTGGGGGTGKGGAPYPREMRIDARGWTSENKKLDVTTTYDGFQVWKDRALMFLSRERPDVRKLLLWAETQDSETLAAGLAAQAAHIGVPDLAGVEYALHDGIKLIILDSLLGRARNCVERGCELWRSLCAQWSGAAPQLQHAKARRYQDPARCKTVQELWSRLPAWERLGEEVVLSGFAMPPWLACVALEQLLPTQLRDALVARASCGDELKTFPQRLAWVKTQMEYARGQAQATAYAPGSRDASGDVNMYSVDAPPGMGGDAVDDMAWALDEAARTGDWELADSLQHSIYALKGGKGGFRKGLGKGKPGKGGAPPAAAAKGAGAAVAFEGACRHCGIWGHRMSECRRLTAELGKAGKGKAGKGKDGGKGGPKGGKGPPGDPILEVAAGAPGDKDDWAGQMLDGAIDAATAQLDEWALGGAIYSLAPAGAAQTFSGVVEVAASASRLSIPPRINIDVSTPIYQTFTAVKETTYKTFSPGQETFAVQPPFSGMVEVAASAEADLAQNPGDSVHEADLPQNPGDSVHDADLAQNPGDSVHEADLAQNPGDSIHEADLPQNPGDSVHDADLAQNPGDSVHEADLAQNPIHKTFAARVRAAKLRYDGVATASASCSTTPFLGTAAATYEKYMGRATVVRNSFSALDDASESAKIDNLAPCIGRRWPRPVRDKHDALSLLTDDAEELLGAVSGDAVSGQVIEAVVDSGAVHSVAPPGLFPGRMVPSPWSRAGRGYRAANGTGIKNLGQVSVRFATVEGDKCSIPFQVAEVDQPLLSVAHLTAAGNRVELGHTDGRIVNTISGRSIALERRGGVYIMKMFLADAAAPAPFRRQGA
jgi:hypothetical protein